MADSILARFIRLAGLFIFLLSGNVTTYSLAMAPWHLTSTLNLFDLVRAELEPFAMASLVGVTSVQLFLQPDGLTGAAVDFMDDGWLIGQLVPELAQPAVKVDGAAYLVLPAALEEVDTAIGSGWVVALMVPLWPVYRIIIFVGFGVHEGVDNDADDKADQQDGCRD